MQIIPFAVDSHGKTSTIIGEYFVFDHPLSLLFFAAALQGFLLSGVLGLHKRNAQANHILAVWVALLSMDLLGQIYYAENIFRQFPQLIGLTNFLPLSYGGFLFLYVRSLTQAKPLQWHDSLHFIGFFIGLLLNLPTLLQSSAKKLQFVEDIIANQVPWHFQIVDALMPVYATAYGIFSGILLWRYQQSTTNNMPRLRWLQTLLIINMIIWLVVWACTLAPALEVETNNQLVYLLVSLFIYIMGYVSLRQPDIFAEIKANNLKYGDNRLPDDLRAQILTALEQYMHEHSPWRASSFNLAQLAEHTGIASHHISQVLNDHLGQSFNDYLNQFRINAICQRLREPHSHNLLDLALECGFSSKSSFNAIFKKYTQQTPSEYRKQVQG
jgi:AraC-like DNA-binding protein